MEKMPYQPDLDRAMKTAKTGSGVTGDWRDALPVLTGAQVRLRELEISDATSLFAMLTPEEVSRFISPPPTTIEGFERFITWACAERAAGRYTCFAVVPHGMTAAIGLFQVRQLEPGFETAEWGFAIGSQYWGTGVFLDGGRMVVDFAIETLGVRRLEARASVANERGNGALRKLGAQEEGVLRRSLLKNGVRLDQKLWSILNEEWRKAKAVWGNGVIH
jgi:RimJ/RimL family protein N-acetyltransferase